MTPATLIRLRKLTQAFCLFLFLAGLVWLNTSLQPSNWGTLFLTINPLLGLAASLGSRLVLSGFAASLVFLAAGLLLGRAWCGWVCPMGTTLEWVQPKRRRSGPLFAREHWKRVKYLILTTLILLALLGNLFLAAFDPITLFYRTAGQSGLPAVRWVVMSVETFLYRFEGLWGLLDRVHASLIVPLLGEGNTVFQLATMLFLTFAAIIGLNWLAERFWCRNLCPLGAFNGLLAHVAWLKRAPNDHCTACGQCARICPTGAILPESGFASSPAECILCFECAAACRYAANPIRFSPRHWKPGPQLPYDPGRRTLLAGAGLAAAVAVLSNIQPSSQESRRDILRPPGSAEDFRARCIRCGACINVCPTQGLQSSGLEGGWDMLLTPRLVPRIGQCDYNCTACTQICPSQALRPLGLEEKRAAPIGLASIDRDRCLPWAYNTPCLICEEACPLPEKAIRLVEETALDAHGASILLQLPAVIRENCIGCGICEHQCPVSGEAAIRVFSPYHELSGPQNL